MRVTRPLGRFCACFTILVTATGMIATLHQRLILSIVSEHEYFRILFIRKTFLLYFAKINTKFFNNSEELIFPSLISILHYSIKNFFKNITKKKALQVFSFFKLFITIICLFNEIRQECLFAGRDCVAIPISNLQGRVIRRFT